MPEDHEQREAERKRREQIEVRGRQRVVDDPLQVERAHGYEDFDDGREHQNLTEGSVEPGDAAHQRSQPNRCALLAPGELGPGPELERDPRERARCFLARELAFPGRGVVHDQRVSSCSLQHDEVIEIPVENTGRSEMAELVEVETYGSSGETEP